MDVQAITVRRMGRRQEDLLRGDPAAHCINQSSASTCIARASFLRPKRIEVINDGRAQYAGPRHPLLSSAQTAWSGFPLERILCHGCGSDNLLFLHAEVILLVAGYMCANSRELGNDDFKCAYGGTVTIWPAGFESSSSSWTFHHREGSHTEMLRVQLDMSALKRLAPEDNPIAGVLLTPQTGIEDSTLTSLMRLMEAEVASGCPAGRLYGESLSLALAAHIATHYSKGSSKQTHRSGLSRPVLMRVLDYIYANLGRDLTIIELAAVANMSAHHFSSCFKRSVGVAPHQWVVRARIREAARLLRTNSMSVADVALALGFASQTHFTDVFRRVTGTTPRHYRHR